ncbi:MAG: hypothetical protein ABI461_06520, partial [Polyangiaceae bacterium]
AAAAYGRALRRAGHLNEATDELRRGANLFEGRSGDAAILLHVELARTAIAKREFGPAMVQCKVVQDLSGGAAEGHACAAEAHLLWRRATEALDETQKALAISATNVDAKIAEGNALGLELKDAQSEAAFLSAIQLAASDPATNARAHLGLARMYVATAKRDAAISTLKTAANLDATDPDIAFELSKLLTSPTEALPYVETAARERPTFAEAIAYRASVYLALNRIADAQNSAAAALKLEPQNPTLHVTLGRTYLAQGKLDDAAAEGKAALAILGTLAPAKLLVADAYAKKGEIDLAVENYQDAWGFDHLDPTALVNASVACHLAGRDTSAKAFGLKATQEFPNWGPAWVALGDARVTEKETNGAREAFTNALKSSGPVDHAAVSKKLAALH